jgi:hypothetical protein
LDQEHDKDWYVETFEESDGDHRGVEVKEVEQEYLDDK